MLTTLLEDKVRGGKWHALIDKVYVEQKLQDGYVYVVDADLKGYFDTIPKDRLLALVKEHISDSRMLTLIKLFPDQNILEELREWTPIAGVPQGGRSFTSVVKSVSQSAGS